MRVLSADQREQYQRDGFIVLPRVFNDAECGAMRAESDRLSSYLVDASLALDEVSPRLDIRVRDDELVLLKIQPLNDVSPLLADVSRDERLLAPLRELLGAEPLLLEEKLNTKQRLPLPVGALPARPADDSFPFHCDFHYFWLDGYPRETVSSAVAVDACTVENGALRVVPGSHAKEWPLGSTWPPYLADGLFGRDDEVALTCPAGTVIIFHSCLAHASHPNTTTDPRRLLIYSHYPATHAVEPDARNRALRRASQEHETRYENTRREAVS